MIAGIYFNIYGDFSHLIKPSSPNSRYEEDYSDALAELNSLVEKLVSKNKLTFLYKNRRVKVKLPIELRDCGNIIYDDGEIPQWNSVAIKCEIDCEHNNFDWDKFKVGVHPSYFFERLHFIQ